MNPCMSDERLSDLPRTHEAVERAHTSAVSTTYVSIVIFVDFLIR